MWGTDILTQDYVNMYKQYSEVNKVLEQRQNILLEENT